jgi:hypothetical protein
MFSKRTLPEKLTSLQASLPFVCERNKFVDETNNAKVREVSNLPNRVWAGNG